MRLVALRMHIMADMLKWHNLWIQHDQGFCHSSVLLTLRNLPSTWLYQPPNVYSSVEIRMFIMSKKTVQYPKVLILTLLMKIAIIEAFFYMQVAVAQWDRDFFLTPRLQVRIPAAPDFFSFILFFSFFVIFNFLILNLLWNFFFTLQSTHLCRWSLCKYLHGNCPHISTINTVNANSMSVGFFFLKFPTSPEQTKIDDCLQCICTLYSIWFVHENTILLRS
jgi:hypothetical protein